MYTKEQWVTYTKMQDELETLATQYVDEFGNGCESESITGFFVDDKTIEISTYETWRYGGRDTHEYNIPVRYLWAEDWLKEERELQEIQRIAREKAEHANLIANHNNEIAKEKALFLTLKKKYKDT